MERYPNKRLENKIRIQSKIEELPEVLGWLRQNLTSLNCDESTIRKVELACEEAVVNIITHAYKDREGVVELRFRSLEENSVEITLEDQGPEFNPLKHAVVYDPSADLDQRPIGGLGLLFIQQYMDEVRYSRHQDANVLTLIKRIQKVRRP